jgi:hypothetical protein
MKRRTALVSVGANVVVLIALVFLYPAQMLSPGPLQPAHAALTAHATRPGEGALATDCFACHTPWRGSTSERCITCHAPADIGVRHARARAVEATQGTLETTEMRARPDGRASPAARVPFHQALLEPDCLACHREHVGTGLREPVRFSHALLRADMRARCNGCHRPPDDDMHRTLDVQCSACHDTRAWRPSHFDHTRWFALEGEHRARCTTCHVDGRLQEYTCYGCHAHTPANIRAEHLEEGIRDYEDCVECHRSGDEDDIRYSGGDRREGGGDD